MTPGEIETMFRDEAGRALATLIRLLGDFDLAEDALQDAFAAALERWHDEQPPMLNMASPLARSGVWVDSAVAGTTLGSVKIQSAAAEKIAQAAITNIDVRSLDTLSPPAQCDVIHVSDPPCSAVSA